MKQIVLIGTADTAKDIYSFIKITNCLMLLLFAVDHQYKNRRILFAVFQFYVIEELR